MRVLLVANKHLIRATYIGLVSSARRSSFAVSARIKQPNLLQHKLSYSPAPFTSNKYPHNIILYTTQHNTHVFVACFLAVSIAAGGFRCERFLLYQLFNARACLRIAPDIRMTVFCVLGLSEFCVLDWLIMSIHERVHHRISRAPQPGTTTRPYRTYDMFCINVPNSTRTTVLVACSCSNAEIRVHNITFASACTPNCFISTAINSVHV